MCFFFSILWKCNLCCAFTAVVVFILHFRLLLMWITTFHFDMVNVTCHNKSPLRISVLMFIYSRQHIAKHRVSISFCRYVKCYNNNRELPGPKQRSVFYCQQLQVWRAVASNNGSDCAPAVLSINTQSSSASFTRGSVPVVAVASVVGQLEELHLGFLSVARSQ